MTHSYAIAAGTGGTLTIDDANDPYGPANPLITVSSGTQNITTAVSLANGLTISTAAGASLDISGNINGSGNVAMTGSGSVTLSGTNTYSGSTTVAWGSLLIVKGSLPSSSDLSVDGTLTFGGNTGSTILTRSVASLDVTGGLNLNASTGSARSLLIVGTGGFANTGWIDLTSNDLILRNTSTGSVLAQIAAGYNSGGWNGTTGILSSAAAGNLRSLTALGYGPGGNSFDGISTTAFDTLVKYTYYGDANLDGKVDGSDYSRIDSGYLTNVTGWYDGDFNYDNVIDGSDYTLIDNAFNSQGARISLEIAVPTANIASVPEPAMIGLVSIGAVGFLGRRRCGSSLRHQLFRKYLNV